MSKSTPKLAYDATSGAFVMLDTVNTETLLTSASKSNKKHPKKSLAPPINENPIPGSEDYYRLQTETSKKDKRGKRSSRKKKSLVMKPLPRDWKWSGMGEFIPLIEHWITQGNVASTESTALAYLTLLRSMSDARGADSCYRDYDRLKQLIVEYRSDYPEACDQIQKLFDTYFPDF